MSERWERAKRFALISIAVTVVGVRVAAAAPLDYDIPGTIEPLRQPSSMTCWATVASIMHSWKTNSSNDIRTVMRRAGSQYLEKFDADEGLSSGEKPAFLCAMQLRAETPRKYTIDAWRDLLKQHGALWVTTAEGSGFSVHARVLTGIHGDGSASGTSLTIVDPADGAVHSETIAVFIRKFEDVARADLGAGGDLRPQVVHY